MRGEASFDLSFFILDEEFSVARLFLEIVEGTKGHPRTV